MFRENGDRFFSVFSIIIENASLIASNQMPKDQI